MEGNLAQPADGGNPTASIQAEGSTLCVTEVIEPSISALEDLNSTPFDFNNSIQESQENAIAVTVCSSTLIVTTGGDVDINDNSKEGIAICKNMGSPAERTPDVEGELANADTNEVEGELANPQACDNLNDEFLSVGEDNENKQMDFVSEGSISTQENLSWKKESVDGILAVPESPDGNRRLSLKRSRSSCFDSTPSVQVIYKCLTSESKNKLKELLRQWAQWHGEFVGMKEDAERAPLESGDETYFPPLQVGGVRNSTVSFWMDKPSKQARTEKAIGDSTPASQVREKEVPLYDRAGIGALISQETEMSLEGGLESVGEGSRCFNCGSYSHSLKECPRPRDNAAINNARKLLSEKRGSANGSRSASRYYQSSPGGKFDDLKPGVLRSETRQLLGIGERDPPPWLNRMRELGYPPGYLEDQEEEQSGITIFGTNEDPEDNFIGEDGEIVGGNKKRSTAKKMKVHFPGLNAPIPDDADRHIWGSPADISTHDRPSHRVVGRSAHSSSHSAVPSDGTADWEGPPGCSRDNYGRSSKMRSPGFEVPPSNKASPWQPSEQGRFGITPPPRSPHFSRSASDSGRRSPKVAYDEPHSLPPLGHYSSRQSPFQNSRPYHSPSTPNQRFSQRQDNREEDPRRRAWTQAQDALHSMHRNDRYSPARRR